jgi:hypothetical protein
MKRALWLLAVLLALPAGAALHALACSLDNIPSLSANGVLAHLNTTPPTKANVHWWEPFVLTQLFTGVRPVRFAENVREVRGTLPAQAFSRAWKWTFGDGASATGFSATHVYRKPGRYRVLVSAYYPDYHAWYGFDGVLLTLQRR